MKRKFNIQVRRDIFASNLSQSMLNKGISQTLFAEMLGTTQQTVSRWCSGFCEPDYDTVTLMCAFLDETPSDLLGYDERQAKDYALAIIRDKVGNDKHFQKEQQAVYDEHLAHRISSEDAEKRVKDIYSQYFAAYCKRYNFEP